MKRTDRGRQQTTQYTSFFAGFLALFPVLSGLPWLSSGGTNVDMEPAATLPALLTLLAGSRRAFVKEFFQNET